MLHQVKHVLVVQQANQVEGAEAGGAAQSQVPDDHGTVKWKKLGAACSQRHHRKAGILAFADL